MSCPTIVQVCSRRFQQRIRSVSCLVYSCASLVNHKDEQVAILFDRPFQHHFPVVFLALCLSSSFLSRVKDVNA